MNAFPKDLKLEFIKLLGRHEQLMRAKGELFSAVSSYLSDVDASQAHTMIGVESACGPISQNPHIEGIGEIGGHHLHESHRPSTRRHSYNDILNTSPSAGPY